MNYTIGQVSQMYDIPVSTLRYYDREGLFPNLERSSGIRRFSQKELDTLRMIECLKKSGLEIKDIKQFMQWCSEGASTYPQRKELFIKQKAIVEEEIQHMNQILAMLKFKCWYYETAIADGSEERLHQMSVEDMPAEIQEAYKLSHDM